MPTTTIVISGQDCWDLLATQEVARVAWSTRDGVSIVPVNYSVADGALWFRTQPYTSLAREAVDARIAVEVDHLQPATRTAWSVVVTGTAKRAPVHEVPRRVGELSAWAPGPRGFFVRVEPVALTGRRFQVLEPTGSARA